MKSPVFASGTLVNLKAAIREGKISYPAFCWLTDTTQYAFVNKDNRIEIVGNPIYEGSEEDPFILSYLPTGNYEIRGYYRVTDQSINAEITEANAVGATYIYAITTLVIVEAYDTGKKIKCINSDSIVDYELNADGEIIKTSRYSTGGGGGSSSYLDLSDKPKLNNVEIVGNMATEDLIPLGKGLIYDSEGNLSISFEEVTNPSGGTTVVIGS